MTENRYIYLDNAATTRLAAPVAECMHRCAMHEFANPASLHHAGIAAERRVKGAREQLLAAIGDAGGTRGELIWTSGGTEADALGILGGGRANAARGRHALVAVSAHPAVRENAKLLAREGWEVETLPVDDMGRLDPQQVAAAVRADTTLLALMLVNNELGTIDDVAAIAHAARQRAKALHVHCDAVQALGKVELDVASLGVDSLALAAHKLHGPKGVGALWKAASARLVPLWGGGGQQRQGRAGTLNVPGIAGFGVAAELAVSERSELQERWRGFAAVLAAAAAESAVEHRENAAHGPRAAHIVSLSFRGVPAEPLLHVLESRGVLVSAGSACASRSRSPSPVLQAIGVGPEWGTLRFSFGRETTSSDVSRAARILIDAIADFR